MNEIWKPIVGYEGLYEVSNLGNVRSFYKSISGEILKKITDKDGYLRVCLWKDKKIKCVLIHRLVAEAFIPNPNKYSVVNHKDERPSNNCVDNLEWCTQKYNTNYGTRNSRIIATRKKNNTDNAEKPVKQKTLDNKIIFIWPSTREAERNGFSSSHISDCCNGKSKTHKGYKWEYVDNKNNCL